MGDPVTMAVVGGSIGAMMNKKDPLKGAMLGAMGGYGGGALMGAGMGAGAASTAGTTAAGTAGTTAANLTAVPAFGAPTFSMAAPASSAATGASTAGIFANPTPAIGGITPMTAAGPSTGMVPSSLVQPSFMGSLTSGLEGIGQYAQQNPVLTQMAMQGAQSLLQQQPQQPAPAGLMRGNPTQAQGPQYQFGPPKVSLI
jgi:hypothetical protein